MGQTPHDAVPPASSLDVNPTKEARDAEGLEGQRNAGRGLRPGRRPVDEVEGYTVNFTTFRQDIDATPLMKGLPDDRCQCPHWGYVIAGKVTFRFADREEIFEAGDAFYTPPGHIPVKHEPGTEILMFSPAEELARPRR